MAVIQSAEGAAIANVGAVEASALHVTAKPNEYGVFGHYQYAGQTGAVGAGAGADSEVFQFWWTNTLRIANIYSVKVTGLRATTAFAAGVLDLKLTRATAWTVAGTGGTALTLVSPSFELRQAQMGVTGATEIRIATTAALGAGTKTLDTYDLGQITAHSSGGVGSATPIIGALYLPTLDLFTCDVGGGEHPLTLEAGDGFVVRATVPATGVWNLGLVVKWSELGSF